MNDAPNDGPEPARNAEPGGVPSDPPAYEGWVSVFECGTDFEADLVRDRLDEQGIAAVVFTQRDHVFNLNLGDLASVHVMVKPEDEATARAAVAQTPASDAELEQAALEADPNAPDAYDAETEASLDSGMDSLNLSIPSESGDAGTSDADASSPDPNVQPGADTFRI